MPAPDADLQALEAELGYRFQNQALLEQALTHASYAHEQTAAAAPAVDRPGEPTAAPEAAGSPAAVPGRATRQDAGSLAVASNEVLEFLGDAVLELLVSDYAVQRFPHYDEGQLTRFRSACVGRDSLVRLARMLKIGAYLRVGRGEERTGGRRKASLLANAVEALIAAIYLDAGLATTRHVVLGWLERSFGEVLQRGLPVDYKSRLQEYCQQCYGDTPVYTTLTVSGPDHAKQFEVAVQVGETCRGSGRGTSRKSAQQAAALAALHDLGILADDASP